MMTQADKIAFVKALSEETDDAIISAQLTRAESDILNRMYSCWTAWPENVAVPARYEATQCTLALRYLCRMGAEGQTAHGENEINRTYANADDSDILRTITPVAEVPK